jgi:hypothetical protein
MLAGGAVAALLLIGIGSACALRNGFKTYAKARSLASHPVFVQGRTLSMIAASYQMRGEELTALVARAFAAMEQIAQALAMLRDIFTPSSPLLRSDSEAHASRVQSRGN